MALWHYGTIGNTGVPHLVIIRTITSLTIVRVFLTRLLLLTLSFELRLPGTSSTIFPNI